MIVNIYVIISEPKPNESMKWIKNYYEGLGTNKTNKSEYILVFWNHTIISKSY